MFHYLTKFPANLFVPVDSDFGNNLSDLSWKVPTVKLILNVLKRVQQRDVGAIELLLGTLVNSVSNI